MARSMKSLPSARPHPLSKRGLEIGEAKAEKRKNRNRRHHEKVEKIVSSRQYARVSFMDGEDEQYDRNQWRQQKSRGDWRYED